MDNIEINKNMDGKQENSMQLEKKQPDENNGVHIQGHIKIFDPETAEVFVQGRA